jgi:hypothetical protein
VRPPAGHRVGHRGERGYASAVDDVGRGLLPALRALESAAADPSELEDHGDVLPALQYALHVAAERVLGLDPVPGVEEAHEDLGAALALAREETAAVAEALDEAGAALAAALVWEWRVSLFGVRLALRQLDARLAAARPVSTRPAYAPVLLLAVGVAGVLGGALAGAWPVWLAGLTLVAVSTGLSQRRP